MRKIVVHTYLTLDGVVQAPGGLEEDFKYGGWSAPYFAEDDEAANVLQRPALRADGDIMWYWGDESQGGQRKYFRITEKGRATYERNKTNWEYAKRVLDTLL